MHGCGVFHGIHTSNGSLRLSTEAFSILKTPDEEVCRVSKAIERKKQVVAEIAEKLEKSKSTIVADYRGLDVKQMNELRKQLREAGVEFKVLKIR